MSRGSRVTPEAWAVEPHHERPLPLSVKRLNFVFDGEGDLGLVAADEADAELLADSLLLLLWLVEERRRVSVSASTSWRLTSWCEEK